MIRKEKKKVFILGDSISIQYGPYLKRMMIDSWEYDRKKGAGREPEDLDYSTETNGGDSAAVLAWIRENRDILSRADLLMFNCGLHDIKTDPATGSKQVPILAYERNLEEVLRLLSEWGIEAWWIRTTPVDGELHNRMKGFHRYVEDVARYNEVADTLMQKHGVPVIDLYAFTASLGAGLHYDGVHFHEHVRELQAAFLAGNLSSGGMKR